jgi:solute carrier family 50 (sugar transporter)
VKVIVMSVKDIFLKHVVPIAGGIIAVLMFGSPLKAVWEIRKKQHIGVGSFMHPVSLFLALTGPALQELNPLPLPVIAANCAAWCAYSYVISQPYLFVPNAFGMLFGMYMTSMTLPFASVKVCHAPLLHLPTIALLTRQPLRR